MRWIAFRALMSFWRRKPLQLATLVAGLALATALWSGVQAINAEARASYGAAADVMTGVGAGEVVAAQGAPLTLADYATLRRAGWQVTPVLDGRIRLAGRGFRVQGVETLTSPMGLLPLAEAAQGAQIGPAQMLTAPGVILADPETAATLASAGGDARAPLGGARLIESARVAPGTLLTDIATAERLLDPPAPLTRILLIAAPGDAGARLATLAPHLRVAPPAQDVDTAALTRSFHLNLTAFGLLSFAVGLFIVNGAIGLAFQDRRATIRTIRAIGMPLRSLIVLLAAEIAVIAIVAGTLGLIAGYAIAALLLPDVAATLRGLYGAAVPGELAFRPGWALAGLGLTLVGAAAAGAQALWSVARMPLLASALPRAWGQRAARSLRVQGALALVALGVAIGATTLFDGLVAGFVLLGAFLIAAALALPLALSGFLAVGAWAARGPRAEWFWSDARQQLPGLSLALMALLLALAANVGVGTMVSSFRLTFEGWLDQRLASELYVTASTEDHAARLRAWLDAEEIDTLPIWNAEAAVNGLPAEVYGIVDHATYRDNWPLLQAQPDVWERVATGGGALINEQSARTLGLSPGDSVDLGGGWRMQVAGIYSDYGNPRAQAIVGLEALLARHPDIPRLRHGLRVAEGDIPSIRARLAEEVGISEGAMIDQAALKALSLGVFERTFAVTGALNALTLGVAGVAILTSLLTLAAQRLPQVAPVWALGLTRADLGRTELLRAGLLAGFTIVLALPVGLGLAWVLLAIVNVEAFGWRLPMHLFPIQWLWLMGIALLAALVSAAWPARRLARTPPARLLGVFANER